jgi:Putative auto-transporter adhesin, head GIN domain
MRDSQIAVAGALGLLVLGVFVVVAALRFALGGLPATLGIGGDHSGPAAGSAPAVGAGPAAERRLELDGFDGVDIRSPVEVELIRGDDWNVELSHPEGAANGLDVGVENRTLVIGPREGSRPRRWFGQGSHYHARIVMPKLERIDISRAGTVSLTGFDGESLDINVAGAAKVEAHGGRYDKLRLTGRGAGDFELQSMPVVDAEVHLEGASNVRLTMDGGVLSGTLSGVGNIEYAGNVEDERVQVSGFGTVHPAGH